MRMTWSTACCCDKTPTPTGFIDKSFVQLAMVKNLILKTASLIHLGPNRSLSQRTSH